LSLAGWIAGEANATNANNEAYKLADYLMNSIAPQSSPQDSGCHKAAELLRSGKKGLIFNDRGAPTTLFSPGSYQSVENAQWVGRFFILTILEEDPYINAAWFHGWLLHCRENKLVALHEADILEARGEQLYALRYVGMPDDPPKFPSLLVATPVHVTNNGAVRLGEPKVTAPNSEGEIDTLGNPRRIRDASVLRRLAGTYVREDRSRSEIRLFENGTFAAKVLSQEWSFGKWIALPGSSAGGISNTLLLRHADSSKEDWDLFSGKRNGRDAVFFGTDDPSDYFARRP
jgi:hypothetical protein